MRNDPRQTAMDLGSGSGQNSTVKHDIDYSVMPIGQGAGLRKVIVKCPECGKGAIVKHNDHYLTWVHSETLVADLRGRTRRKIVGKCRRKR